MRVISRSSFDRPSEASSVSRVGEQVRIGFIAAEPSGDHLAAGLITALRDRHPNLELFGMTGPRMRDAGCESLADIDAVSVMGIVEVLKRYPELRRVRKDLMHALSARNPDVVVGIDAPDFCLGALKGLQNSRAKRVQVVSPQVWAWRRNRVHEVARSVDKLLTIFPFEEKFYFDTSLAVRFIGHPVADEIQDLPSRAALRDELGEEKSQSLIVAVLPGSRKQEIRQLAESFFAAAALLEQKLTDGDVPDARKLSVLCPYQSDENLSLLRRAKDQAAPRLDVTWRRQAGRESLAVADLALVASGTASLEALLLGTPMVVAYRMPQANYQILKRMVTVPFIAMPNILANDELVPEFVQDKVTPTVLADAMNKWISDPKARADFTARAREITEALRLQASEKAADEIMALVEKEAA